MSMINFDTGFLGETFSMATRADTWAVGKPRQPVPRLEPVSFFAYNALAIGSIHSLDWTRLNSGDDFDMFLRLG